jgi:hypothetical protein
VCALSCLRRESPKEGLRRIGRRRIVLRRRAAVQRIFQGGPVTVSAENDDRARIDVEENINPLI